MGIKYFKINLEVTFISLTILGLLSYSLTFAETVEPEAIACTMDAMMCPDGSYVGRTGPKCEFICPETTSSTTEKEARETIKVRDEAELVDKIKDERTKLDEKKENFEANKEVRQEVRVERQSALTEVRQKRVTNLSANISNRLDAVTLRLSNIITRLESRISTLKQRGIDTQSAETKLNDAVVSLNTAKNLLTNIDTLVYEAVSSEHPYTSWQPVKERYREIVGLIRETHAALKETIQLLKEALKNSLPSGIDGREASTGEQNATE